MQAHPNVGVTVSAYKRLAEFLSAAVLHEEKRCGYLSTQRDQMLTVLDDFAAAAEGETAFTLCLHLSNNFGFTS